MLDLRPHFRHLEWKPRPHSFSVDIASDWGDKSPDDPVFGLYKNCGLWSMLEANILYDVAKVLAPGSALDIGSHTGWTTAHMAAAGMDVVAVDPMLRLEAFQRRFEQNMEMWWDRVAYISYQTSEDYFSTFPHVHRPHVKSDFVKFDLCCVDGDHQPGKPIQDALEGAAHLMPKGAIMLHDAYGKPTRDAVTWLLDHGFRARFYPTVHGVFCCWRGDFEPPPAHGEDIDLRPHIREMEQDFDMSRCE